MILVRRLYSRLRYKSDDDTDLKMTLFWWIPCLLKRVFRNDCGLESLAKMPHIKNILTHLVLCINQRAIRNISNKAVGTGNEKVSYFVSSFLFFFNSSIALQPFFGPWLSRSSSSNLLSSLLSPSSSSEPFLHKCTSDTNFNLLSEHIFLCIYFISLCPEPLPILSPCLHY